MSPIPALVTVLSGLFACCTAWAAESGAAPEAAADALPVMQLDAMPMDSRHPAPHPAPVEDEGATLVGVGALAVSLAALAVLARRRRS